jgi:hypothetical protein
MTVREALCPESGEEQEAGPRERPAVADIGGVGDVSGDFC